MAQTQPIPCRHATPAPNCGWCKIAAHPRYAAHFGAAAPAAPLSTCAHLGQPTGKTVQCPSCKGGVKLKTFTCSVHGECTVGKAAPGVACCTTCPDHTGRQGATAPAPPLPPAHRFTVRDCLYHVYPLAGQASPVWRQRLGMLLSRASLFNGRKVISCMTGDGLEHPREVRRLAEPAGFEVAELANDRNLREAKTLIELLPRFQTDDPARVLFFGHAKGVTRPNNQGVTCHPWATVCHEVCLDYWPLVEAVLSRCPIAGPFKKVGRLFAGSPSAWHYSGTFWWVRSADLFGRASWRDVERKWFAAESQVGIWYHASEAGVLFHECTAATMDLYRTDSFGRVAMEYLIWRAKNEGNRTQKEAASCS